MNKGLDPYCFFPYLLVVIINNNITSEEKMQKGNFNNNRGFGVEIEYIRPTNISKQDICDALTVNCHVEEYNHDTVPYWKIVTDASVKADPSNPHSDAEDHYNGYVGDNEIVSPILYGESGFEQLKEILSVLNRMGCKVNYSCGLHVHHDITDTMVKGKKESEKFLMNLIKFIAKYEHLIYKMVAPSRLDSRQYSTPVRKDYFGYNREGVTESSLKGMIRQLKDDCSRKYRNNDTSIDRANNSPNVQLNRGCGLNLQNVWTRGSVEFRYHNGSLNFDKIVSWIVFTQAIVNKVEQTKCVQMNYVPNNINNGLWRLRNAIGFVVCDRDQRTMAASSFLLKRFKELSNRENDYTQHSDYAYVGCGLTLNRGVA